MRTFFCMLMGIVLAVPVLADEDFDTTPNELVVEPQEDISTIQLDAQVPPSKEADILNSIGRVYAQTVDDTEFICITKPVITDLLMLKLSVVPLMTETIELYKKDVELKDAQLAKWESLYGKSDLQLQESAILSDRQQNIINSNNKWYQSKMLWFLVGITVGATTSTILYYTVK